MQTLYPGAQWRPLGEVDEEPGIVPRLLIFHTIVGGLFSAERYFKTGNGKGYQGTESTFGVGHFTDGASYDGVVFQWQRLDREADAQYKGNPIATSVETADGGDPTIPWSPKQIASLVNLGTWWCQTTGRPAQLARAWNGVGFGYHRLFAEWNSASKSCPGDARADQVVDIIIPAVQRNLAKRTVPSKTPARPSLVTPAFPFRLGHWLGVKNSDSRNHSGYWPADRDDIARWQRQMKSRGWRNIQVTGYFRDNDKEVAEKFAREKKYRPAPGYGRVDAKLWKLAWTAPVT